MEKPTAKRERIDESDDESGRFCEEPEASPKKRFRKNSNIDFVCEITSKMDNEDLGLGPGEIDEEMVWDMMKILQEEIAPTHSCTDHTGRRRFCEAAMKDVVCEIMSKMNNEDLGLGLGEIEEQMVWDVMRMLEEEIAPSPSCTDGTGTSCNGFDELEYSRNEHCSYNAEFCYLFGASDDELGIPGSPSVNDYDYDSFGFFECLETEEVEQQLLLQIWLGFGESVEQEARDLFSVHNVHTVSTQIDSGFCNG
ncbi:hypothetical protein SUGI_0490320 [Cryptomeria japonica]|nr:hypothetical protein SUGI_0490320 [Cryptomeria japonica]